MGLSQPNSFSGMVDEINGMMEAPSNKTYYLDTSASVAYTIQQITIKTVSGTCTAAIQIGGVNVTGLGSISVTSTPQTVSASGANTVSVGSTVTLVISSNSSAADLSFTIGITRS